MSFSVEVQTRQLVREFNSFGKNIEPSLDLGVRRAALEVSNRMRDLSPKAHSGLVNSIQVFKGAPLLYLVAPTKNYASHVEYGTQGGGFPSFDVLFSWVRTKRIQPQNPEWDQRDLTFAIQKKILMKGTPPQPFVSPLIDSGFAMQVLERQINAVVDKNKRKAGL